MRSDHPLFRLFLAIVLNIALALPAFAAFTDNGDGTVTDSTTGLMWMRCTMRQTWNGTTCINAAQTNMFTWGQAKALTSNFAGHSDWRLPKVRELQSIVDYAVTTAPTINGSVFPATPQDTFWSASPYALDPSQAWQLDFTYGVILAFSPLDYSEVRLVRGGQSSALLNDARPTSDYVDHRDGTVTHTPTGLTWMRCTLGQTWNGSNCTGTANAYTWNQARALTQTYAGHSDWRLPDLPELSSLVDYTKTTAPVINDGMFPATPGDWFWSASSYALDPSVAWAWAVNLGNGNRDAWTHETSWVRLVRTGQPVGTFALTVSKTGTGSGTVTSTPSGIDCGSTCTASFASGATVTLTATPASGASFAGWGGDCSGTGACTVTISVARNVSASFNGSLASQTITFDPAPAVTVGGTGTVSATASSGLPVTMTGSTPGICTLSGSTVTGVAVGICTLAANQAGNSSFSPAAQATLSFSIAAAPVPPDPPTITSIQPEPGQATIRFTPPANTGGSPITGYTASCMAEGRPTRTATGTASPLTVRNLTGGVAYQCAVTATNGGGSTGTASAALMLLLD
ncbi:MAG: DUF1566 domain-containing protein [Betaproteobacteria bacterium]|nr:DUF1566 domain-containing protein [Betaproteobacteria bacterium]